MSHPYEAGRILRSPGGSFVYVIEGPCCLLYDKEQLPWPSCSLVWRGKQPSWNRVGPRFVADLAASRRPTYSVRAVDHHGNMWYDTLTLYWVRLRTSEQKWWYWKGPEHLEAPDTVETMENRLSQGARW